MFAIIPIAYAKGICNNALPWLPCEKGLEGGGVVIGNMISALLGLFLIVSGLLAFGYFVLGGIQWITSSGDKTSVEAARNRIVHAIIGLIIVASSWAIITLLLNDFLGICFPNINLPVINQVGQSRSCRNSQRPGNGDDNIPQCKWCTNKTYCEWRDGNPTGCTWKPEPDPRSCAIEGDGCCNCP